MGIVEYNNGGSHAVEVTTEAGAEVMFGNFVANFCYIEKEYANVLARFAPKTNYKYSSYEEYCEEYGFTL